MRRLPVRTTLALLAFLGVACLAAGCGSSADGSTSAAASPDRSADGATDAAPYVKDGPYDVGYATLYQPDGRRVVVWYPAEPGGSGPQAAKEVVDPTSMLRPDLQAKVPADERITYQIDAYADAPPATIRGGAPLVLYSHPYASFPEVSSGIMTHLASWGFVVAAPDHVERSVSGLFGTKAQGVPPRTDVEVLQATIDLLADASQSKGPLHGLVDTSRIAATGESSGAAAAYQLASADPRIDAFISYAVGFGGQFGPAPAAPDKPGMVMLADQDHAIPPLLTKKLYAAMTSPKYLVKVYDAGHEVFTDTCLIGDDDHRLLDVVEEHQLLPQNLIDLAKDGCQAYLPPVSEARPAIDQTSVAFLRWVFGIDQHPVGLDTKAIARLGTPATVTHD